MEAKTWNCQSTRAFSGYILVILILTDSYVCVLCIMSTNTLYASYQLYIIFTMLCNLQTVTFNVSNYTYKSIESIRKTEQYWQQVSSVCLLVFVHLFAFCAYLSQFD